MWIPDWLYTILPILYGVIGAVLLAIFGVSGPALMSVLLLFGAATLTTVWRYRHRQDD
jgi:hypothetical protein